MGLENPPKSLSALLDRIARIAATTLRADVAFITLRRGRKLCVIGCYGIYPQNFVESWSADQTLFRPVSMSFVGNVLRDQNLKNHPILKAAPFTKSMVHVPVQGEHADIEAAITIINPEFKWPFSVDVTHILADLAMVIGDALKSVEGAQKSGDIGEMPGFADTAAKTPSDTKNTAGQFLLSTLANRTSIRNRKDVSYVTLRAWSKPIKEHQISALRIVKTDTDPHFVSAVAKEMADHIHRLFGVPRIGCVVPMPCGHSRRSDCLSVQITRRLSELLSVPLIDALEHMHLPGSSHPKNSANLQMPKLAAQGQQQSVLLVDDVASSGRHIELAVKSLRSFSQHVSAIAWIGAN